MTILIIYIIGFSITNFIINNYTDHDHPLLVSFLWFIFWPVVFMLMLDLGEEE